MSLQQLIHNYAAYNSWANHKIADWLLAQEESLLHKEFASSYKSADLTVQHILCAQKFWTAVLALHDVSKFNWSANEKPGKQNLMELKTQTDEMKELILSFNNNHLEEELELKTSWSHSKLKRYDFIMHAINHSTYHRGQLITIGRGLGMTENVPNTDYSFFL